MGGSSAVLTGVEVDTGSWAVAAMLFTTWELGDGPLPLQPRLLRLRDIAARAVALELERNPFAHDFSRLPPDLRRLVTQDIFRFNHYATSDAEMQPLDSDSSDADETSSGEEEDEGEDEEEGEEGEEEGSSAAGSEGEEGSSADGSEGEEGSSPDGSEASSVDKEMLASAWDCWYSSGDSGVKDSARLAAAASQLLRGEGEPQPQPPPPREYSFADCLIPCRDDQIMGSSSLLGGFGCGWGSADGEPGGGGGGGGGGDARLGGAPPKLPRVGFHQMEQDYPDHRERFFLHAEPPHFVGFKCTGEHEVGAAALPTLGPGVAERLAVVDAIRLFGGVVKPLGEAPQWLLASHSIAYF